MNVFIIPSWYPNDRNPLEGIFIKEQVDALAEIYPDHNFIVSHCDNFYLSFSEPKKFINTYKEFTSKKESVNKVKNNFFVYYKPVVTYTEKLRGEIYNIVNVHKRNFETASKKFGDMNIIHAHVSYPAGYSAYKLKEIFNVKYVITEHMGPFPFDRYINEDGISDKISVPIRNADKVISVSNYSADRIGSFHFNRPEVIPNMVNENIFYPLDENTGGENSHEKKIRFLTVSSFIESKGIEELMNGILRSSDQKINAEFVIAGTGEMRSFIENFINDNSLSEKVKLISDPSREEVVNLFRECDVFLLPSRLESFGIVYVEAMACGKPVIATDCGGPRDFMNNSTGLLIPVNDTEAIYNAIKSVSDNLQNYSSEKIRQYFLNKYSREAVCGEIMEMYKEVLKN